MGFGGKTLEGDFLCRAAFTAARHNPYPNPNAPGQPVHTPRIHAVKPVIGQPIPLTANDTPDASSTAPALVGTGLSDLPFDRTLAYGYRDVFLVLAYGGRTVCAPVVASALARLCHTETCSGPTHVVPYAAAVLGEESRSTEASLPVAMYPAPSSAEAAALFRSAGLFVVFGPGPELATWVSHALRWQVPVVSGPGADMEALLGPSLFQVQSSDPQLLAAVIRLFQADRALARTVAAAQRRRWPELFHEPPPESIRFLVDGPFDSSYSLALVNREAARALERIHPGHVALDFLSRPPQYPFPDALDPSLPPDVQILAERSRHAVPVDTVLWNSYPPHVSGRPGALSVLHSYGWEETGYPEAFLRRFAQCVDGVTVMSRAVQKVLVDNGLPLPLRVVGLGTDHILRTEPIAYDGDLGRPFRFLSVSSAFPRKGLDVLLEAYGRAFTDGDAVSLVLKTFPNPHNDVAHQIEAFRHRFPDPPHVVLIDRDLPDGMLVDLYRRCHAFVAPSRGEGFGLPLAEAMLLGLPVITTEGSGQADFCTPETAWLVPARYAPARTHLSEPGSLWLEPDVEALARLLRSVFEASKEERAARCQAARRLMETHFTWEAWRQRTEEALHAFRCPNPWRRQTIPVVWVSTWGGRCGIARYSQYLLDPLRTRGGAVNVRVLAPTWDKPLHSDPDFVHRCWTGPDVAEAVVTEARKQGAVAAVVQYHPAFFDVARLVAVTQGLHQAGVLVWITFHATRYVRRELAEAASDLAKAARLAVHSVDDVNFFKDLGLEPQTVLWPHGVPEAPPMSLHEAKALFGLEGRRVLTTFGFLMPHKGVLPLLKAFRRLLGRFWDLFLVVATSRYPSEDSVRHAEEVREAIGRMGLWRRTLFLTDFLEESAALALLQASDLIVYPYQSTEESSSAAVRFGIASGRPVACTPLPIFDDVEAVVHRLPGTDPAALAEGLEALLADEGTLTSRCEAQQRWIARNAWPAVADRFERVLRALLINRPEP